MKEDPKGHVPLLGQPTTMGAYPRFANLGDGVAVFVVDQNPAGPLHQTALDLLDRTLLRLDPKSILRIQSDSGGTALTLARDKEAWRVQSTAAQFTADKEVMEGVLKVFSNLQAEKFAAYGAQANLAQYGLDHPTATITISVEPKPGIKKPAPLTEHRLMLGKPVEKEPTARYARLDNSPGIAILA